MTSEPALFGDDEPPASVAAPTTPAPIADRQVELLRTALDARGLTEMAERQHAVEEALGRPVVSLRDLSSEEANRVLGRLGRSGAERQASQWDERDEDTWIDRL